MSNAAKLLAEAMTLPVGERVRMASELLRSVDESDAGDEDVAEAWIAEIDRRSASVQDGTATLISSAEAHARVRKALQSRRAAGR